MIYNAVNNSYTDYHWLMTVKQARPKTESSSKTYYYNCKDCFSILDPKGQYDFLIAGIPRGSTYNETYISQRIFFN